MKIGTLTFHRACNYGGILQCFALIKALTEMGYHAEVIDYRSSAIEDAYKTIKIKGIKPFIVSLLYCSKNRVTKKNFRWFVESHIPISKKVYKSANQLSNQYDFCFIGSDQIWSKRINKGFDPVFWGNFLGKKATYAASMGTDHAFTKEEQSRLKCYLENFDFISTREDSLRDEMSSLTDKPIQTVADPTLLVSCEVYKKIAISPQEENYVLYYQMEYHSQSKDFVSNIAKQLGCKVVTLMGPNEDYEDIVHIHKSISEVNVQEFLGLILNARCVIASSFHGTALPIAMRKDFYFLANYETDRAENLLRHIGALDRMKKSTEIITFEPVDYSVVEPQLNQFVYKSKCYIKKCIDNE